MTTHKSGTYSPPPIVGYRALTREEVQRINAVKDPAQLVGGMVNRMEHDSTVDKRWLNIGKTHLQQGFMAMTRSITQPESF